MGKQATRERIEKAQEPCFVMPGAELVPRIFEEHYKLALQSMSVEPAAATAYAAVVNHLASVAHEMEYAAPQEQRRTTSQETGAGD